MDCLDLALILPPRSARRVGAASAAAAATSSTGFRRTRAAPARSALTAKPQAAAGAPSTARRSRRSPPTPPSPSPSSSDTERNDSDSDGNGEGPEERRRKALALVKAVAAAVRKSKRCVVVAGAGISVSAGIPDFRSPNGLYNLVKKRYPNVVLKGKDLFDASLFRDPQSTALFYAFMAELRALVLKAQLTPTHLFLKTLDDQGQLMRCYTQNIDCLENRLCFSFDTRTRVPTPRLIHLHGDLDNLVCTLCRTKFPFGSTHLPTFRQGRPPACPSCVEAMTIRAASGKRALPVGTLRPNVVLYNEHHSNGLDIGVIAQSDARRRPDLLVVVGTSLKVEGVRRLVRDMAKAVHGCSGAADAGAARGLVVFVNRTPPGREWANVFDIWIRGDSDDAVALL
ncbi:DHS-like NAD/FAD-binding domain-containing protein, partial [Zopfochytrium polystomum]